MRIYLQHTRIGLIRLLDANTANESSCFRKNLPSMFVLIYPFTSQIFCINNDIMQRFTYSEKNRDDLLQYNGINFTSRKNGSNFRQIGKPYLKLASSTSAELPLNRKTYWMLIKNRNWVWFMRKCPYFRANECIFALSVAVSRKWLRIIS